MGNKTYTAPAVSEIGVAGDGFMQEAQSWAVYDENGEKYGGGRIKEQGEDDQITLDTKGMSGFGFWDEEED